MKDPAEFTKEELVTIVRAIQQSLWPDGDQSHEQSSDTLGEITNTLTEAGLGPNE